MSDVATTVILEGPNYYEWTQQSRGKALTLGVWAILQGTSTEPSIAATVSGTTTTPPTEAALREHREWLKLDSQAQGIIFNTISESNKRLIDTLTNARAMWLKLETEHNGKTAVNQWNNFDAFLNGTRLLRIVETVRHYASLVRP